MADAMETIRIEKKSRAGIKSNITKLSNKIRQLLDSGETSEGVKEEVRLGMSKLKEAQAELRSVHVKLDGLLSEEWDREEAESYLQEVINDSGEVYDSATRWLENAGRIDDTVNPEDSVSQCSPARSSLSSRARKAALDIELAALKQMQELEAREFKIKQEKEILLLQTKLAKSEIGSASQVTFPSIRRKLTNSEPIMGSVKPQPEKAAVQSGLDPLAPDWDPKRQEVNPVTEPTVLQYIENGQRQQQRLMEVMQLPRAELTMFDGDPLKFWSFYRSFENTVGGSSLDDNSKLTRLLQFCTGKAKNVIQCCSVMTPEEGYKKAMSLLKNRFGDEYKIAEAWLRKVSEGPSIGANDGPSLREFADLLKGCMETLRAMGYEGELNSQSKIVSVVERLPYHLKTRWVRNVRNIRKRNNRPPNINDLVEFVDDTAEEANDPVYGKLTSPKDNRSTPKGGNTIRQGYRKDQGTRATGFSSYAGQGEDIDCPLCNVKHSLFSCAAFKGKRPEERIKIVRQARLCFNCLKPGHFSPKCPLNRTCTVVGCGMKHTKFLHQIRSTNAPVTNPPDTAPRQTPESHATDVTCSVTGAGAKRVALPIVAVKVRAPGARNPIDTFALLDNGSTSTFCTEGLANRLGACGDKTILSLTTLDNDGRSVDTTIVNLEVSGRDDSHTIELPLVYTKAKLNIKGDNLATKGDVESWPHLVGLDLPEVEANEVTLLIGQDVPEALIPLEVRKGEIGDPYAVKTKLGWVVNGPLGNAQSYNASVNFVQGDDNLETQLHRFWKLDANDSLAQDEKFSMNDKRAVSIWEQTIAKKNGHYEVAIPFKEATPSLPPNLEMAQTRLSSLKKRLEKDRELKSRYCDGMNDMLSNGHAEVVNEDDIRRCDGKVWYLPHHPVYHPMKPEKLRIVFDCASTHRGTSLNKQVLQGPDLTNKLLGVLLRFRRESIALMGDIKAMFHQVRVPQDDRDVLRFLWWPDGDLGKTPAVYRMTVHLFGGTWSPSCASFALRHCALANEAQFDNEAVETVLNNFYVDDCLASLDTEDKAISLAKDLRELLATGGFKLTKFVSNNQRVIESIPPEDCAKDIKGLDFNHEAMPIERALGVTWDTEKDHFTFKVKPKRKPNTKRGLLSVVSSVYDPLGFASPVVLKAKIHVQEMCRRKLGWDDPLPNDMLDEWLLWQRDLPKLESLKIDRCIKPRDFGNVVSCELHHFSDASEIAYGTTSYIRIVNNNGDVHTSLLMAKSRLAPLKTMTIPRLELTAATLSVKMDNMLRKELGMTLTDSVFWTDSTLVLQYVKNDDKRFHTFVANRVATIRDGSEPSQWRHVRSEHNPADDVSRGLTTVEIATNQRWLHGPDFLSMDKRHWPDDPISGGIKPDDPEVKTPKEVVQSCATTAKTDGLDCLFSKYSSWYSLKRCVAGMLRVKNWLKSKVKGRTLPDIKMKLSVNELTSAEGAIIRYIQERAFPDEMAQLYKADHGSVRDANVRIKKTSPLYKLSPKLNGDGLISVGGRLRNSPILDQTRFPIILPKKHRAVDLIVAEAHTRAGHSGREYVLSLLMEKFWIIGARSAVRKAARDCTGCKRLLASPLKQRMSDLPVDRVTPGKPPFTHVGVDYFGPFLVKRGRSRVKRYGCIFTCLAIRAVHIEIAHSLDTDSFMNALQRFMCRRGQPELIRSDNGTNFVGAERELKRVLTNWNHGAIHEFLLQRGIRWIFNPPSASHMGGAWERQIRTVRKLMNSLCKEQILDDEALSTLMCLAESIVNGRPITSVSMDPNDSEPLTPNHLLLLRGGSVLPCDKFVEADKYCRKRWRQVQYLAAIFWRRWTREYLPTLQRRQKWIDPKRNIQVGDIVLVVDECLPRNVWLLGRVIDVYSGTDSLVRSAKVKTKTTTLVRPIKKLCLLEAVEMAERTNESET